MGFDHIPTVIKTLFKYFESKIWNVMFKLLELKVSTENNIVHILIRKIKSCPAIPRASLQSESI